MPTAWRTGDFSSLLNGANTSNGKAVQLYNPYALNTTTGLRDPFPNNVIPASLLSPAAVKLLNNSALYPAPQINTIKSNNYFYGASSQLNMDQGDIKLDYRPEDKDYFSFRYSDGRQDAPGLNTFPLFYNSFNTSPFQNGVINWTRTVRPNLINEARFGVNYIVLINGGADKGLGNIAHDRGNRGGRPGPACAARASPTSAASGKCQYRHAAVVRQHHVPVDGQYDLDQGQARHQDSVSTNSARWINVFYAGNNGRSGFIDFNGRFTAQTAVQHLGQRRRGGFPVGTAGPVGQGPVERHLGPTLLGHRYLLYRTTIASPRI